MNIWKILNLISLAGIIVLLVLHFNKPKATQSTEGTSSPEPAKKAQIVYINSDTLRAHYDLVEEMSGKLEEDYSARERDIASRQQRYEKDATYFQKQVEAGALSEQSAQVIYQELMQNQQEILDLRDRYTDEISRREYFMNERYVDSVYNFLERYNADGRYQYILGFSRGSGILNASDTLDITWDVIKKMNEAYRESKEKGSEKL